MLWQKITIHFLIVLPLLVIASCKSGSPPTQNTPVYQLTINVEPAEAGTVSPEAGEFDAGDVVEITASQNEEWIFDSWQGDHSGSANPDSVIMNSDKEITALFVLREYPLTVEIEGEGVVDERVVQGSSGENATVIELTAKPADGWRFVHWEGDIEGNTNPATIVVDSEKNITAVFERREYPLTINIEGKGTVTEEILHSMATDYPFETVVQLTATAAQGWVFSHWEGDVTGSENPEQIEITDDKEVTAVFEKDFFELNIEIDGEGSVETVLVSGSESDGLYEYESIIELTAVPEDGWGFDQWSGDISGSVNPITIEINVENDVVATFGQQGFTLSITSEGEGSVLIHPEKEEYYYGEEVELTAEPEEGWIFSHWEGDLSGDENPETILLEGSKTISAIFEATPVTDEITMVDLRQYGLTNAVDINDHGHIIGGSHYWNPGTEQLIDMGISGARAMNNNGQVISSSFYWDRDVGSIMIDTLTSDNVKSSRTLVYDINDHGIVVGEVDEMSPYGEYDIWPIEWNSTSRELIIKGFWSTAKAINNHNHVTGISYIVPESQHGIYVTFAKSFGPYEGYSWGEPWAINNNGQVVGYIAIGETGSNFLASNNTQSESMNIIKPKKLLRITNTLGLYDYGHVVDMIRNGTFDSHTLEFSESGTGFNSDRMYNKDLVSIWSQEEQQQIIERALSSFYGSEAFLWDELNGVQTLGTLGGDRSVAFDINDHGQVVGYSSIGEDKSRAFYWDSKRGMIELPSPPGNSIASAINNKGQIVGSYYDENWNLVPVMWEISFEQQDLSVFKNH